MNSNTTLSSDEVNYMIYRYLQESGFNHSAFAFGHESLVTRSGVSATDLPPGSLVTFIQKGIQYLKIEARLEDKDDNVSAFELISPEIRQLKEENGSANGPQIFDDHQNNNNTPFNNNNNNNTTTHTFNTRSNNVSDYHYHNSIQPPSSRESKKISDDGVRILRGHQSEVFICAWSPRASILASGSGDSTARLWNIPEGPSTETSSRSDTQPVVLYHSNNARSETSKDVTTLDWNSDGTMLATGSYDGKARIWTHTGDLLATFNRHKGPIFSLKWNRRGDYLLSGSVDYSAIVWDVNTGQVKQQFQFHKAPTLDVDWKDNTSFATCSTDKSIFVCRLGEQEPIQRFIGHEDEVNAIKWDPSGVLLASCSDDYSAKIWNAETGRQVHDFREHTKEIYTIKWSPTGPNTQNPNGDLVLASASFDASVKIWDIEAGKCLHTLTEHNDPVYSVAFSPDGKYLASGSFDRCLHIWSVKDGKLLKTYTGSGSIFEVCWNSTGDKVAACFADNSVCVIDFRK